MNEQIFCRCGGTAWTNHKDQWLCRDCIIARLDELQRLEAEYEKLTGDIYEVPNEFQRINVVRKLLADVSEILTGDRRASRSELMEAARRVNPS